MSSDLGAYLAGRARVLYPLSWSAQWHELDEAAAARGIDVVRSPHLSQPCCGTNPSTGRPLIGLPLHATPGFLAHELFHQWLRDNVAWGVEYPPWEWGSGDEEAAAETFRYWLCGDL